MRPALMLLGLSLCACTPAALPGPRHLNLQALPDQRPWQPADLLERGEVPRSLLRPLPEALELAPLGSVIVACQQPSAVWGLCTHVTRKVGPALLSEETGALGIGARLRPLTSLLDRDVIFVLDVGVREGQLAALDAQVERLRGAPYLLNGEDRAYDCATYQNALQRALGLPDVVPRNTRWNAHLPGGALGVPTNRVVWVGVRKLDEVRGLKTN
ncbi:hypothetical protein [Deinococcus koreensis]|uniref:Uncharacterized protein n=1 Tax=Deinococcus koreensis TaxID=2054903 RepID=A0A2K3UV84_9DEIO|nr:hypothetical protein [Deinococcus koreensis]PNY80420.1 hypothetical protein CVO96_02680 [Deinococcus koreensis]